MVSKLEFRAIQDVVVAQWERKHWPTQLAIVTVVSLWLIGALGFVAALFAGDSPPTRTTVIALTIAVVAIGVVFIKRGKEREQWLVGLAIVGSGMSLMNDVDPMGYGSEPTPLAMAMVIGGVGSVLAAIFFIYIGYHIIRFLWGQKPSVEKVRPDLLATEATVAGVVGALSGRDGVYSAMPATRLCWPARKTGPS